MISAACYGKSQVSLTWSRLIHLAVRVLRTQTQSDYVQLARVFANDGAQRREQTAHLKSIYKSILWKATGVAAVCISATGLVIAPLVSSFTFKSLSSSSHSRKTDFGRFSSDARIFSIVACGQFYIFSIPGTAVLGLIAWRTFKEGQLPQMRRNTSKETMRTALGLPSLLDHVKVETHTEVVVDGPDYNSHLISKDGFGEEVYELKKVPDFVAVVQL